MMSTPPPKKNPAAFSFQPQALDTTLIAKLITLHFQKLFLLFFSFLF
jgi:hypothetical protein